MSRPSRRAHRLRLLLAAAILAGFPAGAAAHELRPGFLELREAAPGTFRVLWKVPMRGDLRLGIDPVFPETCRPTSAVTADPVPGALIEQWTVACDGGLAGRTIAIDGLAATVTDVLLRVEWAGGAKETRILRSTAPSVTLGEGGAGAAPAWGYLSLGVEHILLGADHLLFVLGLVLIVSDRGTLIKTVTAFTVAHSITLAVATLGYASVPVPPLNAAIALSILFLGPEIVRAWRGETSLTIRHPWVVAFVFGLLHGFGFASGLSTVGLPKAEIPLALLLFNVGVELGQIAFVALVLALERSFRVLETAWPRWVQALPAYCVGGLGAYWTIQRAVALVWAGA